MPFISPKILCRRYNLAPKKSLGQNFLLHPDQARRLVAALDLHGHETVVEIGPGLGALTFFLAHSAAQVIALELDQRLFPILREEVLADISNVEVLSPRMSLSLTFPRSAALPESPWQLSVICPIT